MNNRIEMQPKRIPGVLSLALLMAAWPSAAQAQGSVTCASVCSPRADYTAGEYNKCMQTCAAQASKCLATKGIGTLFPKYYIMGLVYAPPGCSKTATLGCSSQSTVDYLDGSSMGTKLSTQSSFQKGISLSINASIGGDKAPKFGASVSGGYSTTNTDTNSTTVSKTTTLDIKASGNGDGINHDQDTFILLLNPAIALRQTSIFNGAGSCSAGAVNWLFGLNTSQLPNEALFKVTVGELKNPASMPAATATQLNALNFTSADYQTILAQDPFANGSTAVDPNRFVPTTTSFPYEPPDQTAECPNGVCSCVSISSSVKNEFATEVGQSTQTQYKVGVTETLSGISLSIFTFGASSTQDFTWTNTSTDTDTTDSTQTASVAVQCPSVNYTGPTLMTVYWDKLYGSFMFVPTQLTAVQNQLLSQGTLTSATGQVMRHQPVTLTMAGKTLHTFSDSSGKYRFTAPPGMARPATGQLTALGAAHSINIGATQDIQAVH